MQDDWVSVVTHELRTPLTSIRGALGLLAQGIGGKLPDSAEELVEIAARNSKRLALLIDDVLDIQKIESGELAARMTELEIEAPVRDAILETAAHAELSGVRIVRQGTGNGIIVRGDHDLLVQVMVNLVVNAVKHSRQSQEVEIAIEPLDDDRVRISVVDHGEGIPEEFRERVFDKFSQADTSTTRAQGGTGLGLYIARALVEQHGGAIGFESEVGLGTTFWFDLPRAQ